MGKRTHRILVIIGLSLFYIVLCQTIIYLSLASQHWLSFDLWQMLGLSALLGIFCGTLLPMYFYQHTANRLRHKKHTKE